MANSNFLASNARYDAVESVMRAYAVLKKDPTKFGAVPAELYNDNNVLAVIKRSKKELGIESLSDDKIEKAFSDAMTVTGEKNSGSVALDNISTKKEVYDAFLNNRRAFAATKASEEQKVFASADDYAELKLVFDAYNVIIKNPIDYGVVPELDGTIKKEALITAICDNYTEFGYGYHPQPQDIEKALANAATLAPTDKKSNVNETLRNLDENTIAQAYMGYKKRQDKSVNTVQSNLSGAQEELKAAKKANSKFKWGMAGGVLGKIGMVLAVPAAAAMIISGAAAIAGGFAELTSIASFGLVTLTAATMFLGYHALKGVFSKLWKKLSNVIMKNKVRLDADEKVLGSQKNLKMARANERAAQRENVNVSTLAGSRNYISSKTLDELEAIATGKNVQQEAEEELNFEEESQPKNVEPQPKQQENVVEKKATPQVFSRDEEALGIANSVDEYLLAEEQQQFAKQAAEEYANIVIADVQSKRSGAEFSEEQKQKLVEEILTTFGQYRSVPENPDISLVDVEYSLDGINQTENVSVASNEVAKKYTELSNPQSQQNKTALETYHKFLSERNENEYLDTTEEEKQTISEGVVANRYVRSDYAQEDGLAAAQTSAQKEAKVVEKLYRGVSDTEFLSIIKNKNETLNGDEPLKYQELLEEYDKQIAENFVTKSNKADIKSKKAERIKDDVSKFEQIGTAINERYGEEIIDDKVRTTLLAQYCEKLATTYGLDNSEKEKLTYNVNHYFTEYIANGGLDATEVLTLEDILSKFEKLNDVNINGEVVVSAISEELESRCVTAENSVKERKGYQQEFKETKEILKMSDSELVNYIAKTALGNAEYALAMNDLNPTTFAELFANYKLIAYPKTKDEKNLEKEILGRLKVYYAKFNEQKEIREQILKPDDKKYEIERKYSGLSLKTMHRISKSKASVAQAAEPEKE